MFVPGVADLPSNLRTLSPVYFTSQLRLSQFIQPHVCQTIRSQSLSALTVDARVDTDNVYALLPSGKDDSLNHSRVTTVFPLYCRKTDAFCGQRYL